MKNGEKDIRTGGNSLEARFWRVLSGRNSLMAKNSLIASHSVTAFPVSRSCVFFTHFCFELTFCLNMKVFDNCVRFPVAFVSLQNVLENLIYSQITTHRSRGILHKTLL